MAVLSIEPDEIKQILEIYGINTSLLDDQLLVLCSNKVAELSDLIGVPIGLVDKIYIDFEFQMNKLFLPFYPVELIKITLDGEEITDYKINKYNGYIKFTQVLSGELKVYYKYGLVMDEAIKKLVLDMVASHVKYGFGSPYNSIHEGDVSITYNGRGFDEDIQKRIDNLRNNYTARLKVI